MPQFILDTSGDVDNTPYGDGSKRGIVWGDLDAFTQGYIEALFFTSEAPGVTTEEWQATEEHDEGNIPGDVGFSDLDPETLADIVKECATFQHNAGDLLPLAYERGDYSAERAGHDFWLTRNHHGAGFWDRQELEADDLGDRLTDLSHHYGESDAYLGDDGKVYLS